MTATLNSNGDICAVQKGGGEGVMSSVVMQCMRIASVKAADITSKIKNAVSLISFTFASYDDLITARVSNSDCVFQPYLHINIWSSFSTRWLDFYV